MDSLIQVNTLNLIYTFLYQNDLYQSIDLHDYFGKENKIFKNPKIIGSNYYRIRKISIKLYINEILKEKDKMKIISQIFEFIMTYFGKINNIKLILPTRDQIEKEDNYDNLKLMNKVLQFLQKQKAFKNFVLYIKRKTYYYFDSNNNYSYFLLPILSNLIYDSVTFVIDNDYFDPEYPLEPSIITITKHFKLFLEKQTNIKTLSLKTMRNHRYYSFQKFYTEFFYPIIESIPDSLNTLKLKFALCLMNPENKEKAKEFKNILNKLCKFQTVKINKSFFPLFSSYNFSNQITNLEIYIGDDEFNLYPYEKFYTQSDYSWENFKSLENVILYEHNKDFSRTDSDWQKDKFLNLENAYFYSLKLKTCADSHEDFFTWVRDIKLNPNIQEINIIIKKPFNSFEEIKSFKSDFKNKINQINENIIFTLTFSNLISNKPLIHYEDRIDSEFYVFLFAIELSRQKKGGNRFLQKLYKFPILQNLNKFFKKSFYTYDVYAKKQ